MLSTISGTGSTLPTLDNGGAGSNVTIPTTSAGGVSVVGMTISGGNATSGTASGGGIEDLGSGLLSVSDDTFTGNAAGDHGARSTSATGASARGACTETSTSPGPR